MRLPRPIKNSLLPLLLLFAAQKVCAQLAPADDFFNSGAQAYISNNIPAALERTEDGLKIYPNDDKLQKLEKLLKQQQQQQQQQQNQSQQQQSQSQQNSKNQQNQQQNQQQQSQQNSQDQKKSDEQKQSEQQKSSEQKSNDKENQNGENQTTAGQMTPEEAKRLLDAQKGDEQVLQMKPQGKPQDQNKPVKDW
jgi:Ca-activated chloride channel family protein